MKLFFVDTTHLRTCVLCRATLDSKKYMSKLNNVHVESANTVFIEPLLSSLWEYEAVTVLDQHGGGWSSRGSSGLSHFQINIQFNHFVCTARQMG